MVTMIEHKTIAASLKMNLMCQINDVMKSFYVFSSMRFVRKGAPTSTIAAKEADGTNANPRLLTKIVTMPPTHAKITQRVVTSTSKYTCGTLNASDVQTTLSLFVYNSESIKNSKTHFLCQFKT